MATERFADRVRALRDNWVERRQVRALASAHDFDSQYRLLCTLHEWAGEGVRDIRGVYGPLLPVRVSPSPPDDRRNASFSVVLGDAYVLSFALTDRRRSGASRWYIAVSMASAGPAGNAVAAGPERRNGQWTRGRLEDLLLTVLGAYERSSGKVDVPGSLDDRLKERGT